MYNTTSEKSKNTAPLFQFGRPIDQRTSAIQGEISIDFRKLLKSWFKFLSPRNIFEGIKVHNTSDDPLQNNLKEKTRKSDGKLNNKLRKTNKIYIDLLKLDKLPCLNKHEKRQLKRLIHELKCDIKNNKYEETRKLPKCRKTFASVTNKGQINKNDLKRDKNSKSIFESSNIANKSISYKMNNNSLEYVCCRKCLESGNASNTMHVKRKQRIPATTITLSDKKHLESFINVDPRSYGDSASSYLATRDKLFPIINAIPEKKNEINIKRIELKYIVPTYVLQYNTQDQTSRQIKDSYLEYSNLNDHVVRKPASTTKREALAVNSVPAENNKVLVGITVTPSQYNVEETRKSKTLPERKTWVDDRLPSYFFTSEQCADPSSANPSVEAAKKGTACKKLTRCIKWCLCLSSGECAQSSSRDVDEQKCSTKPNKNICEKRTSKIESESTKTIEEGNSKNVKFRSIVSFTD